MKILQSVSRQVIVLLVAGAVFALSGCGQGHKTWLRVMDATPQESEIDVSLSNNSFATNVAYGTTTYYSAVSSGSHTLQVYPPGVATPYIDQTISLTSGDKYTVLSANVLSSANALLLIDEESTPASNTAELRFVNASPNLGTVDVYLVSPGTDLSSVLPTISGLAFEAVSTYQSLTATKEYEVYFTVANQKNAQIDSGPVSYSNAEVRTMVALNGEASGYTLAVLKDLN